MGASGWNGGSRLHNLQPPYFNPGNLESSDYWIHRGEPMRNDETFRVDLIQRITRNKGGKYWMKIKTLLGEMGYVAQQRVRQSSLGEVLETLNPDLIIPVSKYQRDPHQC
jgi:mRNA degradation ribonuclease J1/J2